MKKQEEEKKMEQNYFKIKEPSVIDWSDFLKPKKEK